MAKFLHYEPCTKCIEAGRDRRGDNLAVYSDGGYHCFSCGYHRSSAFSLDFLKVKETHDPKMLPADFTREVPAVAWEWLLQYGLGWKYWQPYVGWSQSFSRLVFTVGSPVLFSIGRFFGEGDARKWHTWGNVHSTAHIIGEDHEGGKTVLVEDLISAHKVGQVATCLPLFGTKVHPSIVKCARYLGKPLVIWLDKDQQHAAAKRADSLAMMTGLPTSYVFTDNDPKLQSIKTIKELLE